MSELLIVVVLPLLPAVVVALLIPSCSMDSVGVGWFVLAEECNDCCLEEEEEERLVGVTLDFLLLAEERRSVGVRGEAPLLAVERDNRRLKIRAGDLVAAATCCRCSAMEAVFGKAAATFP